MSHLTIKTPQSQPPHDVHAHAPTQKSGCVYERYNIIYTFGNIIIHTTLSSTLFFAMLVLVCACYINEYTL